MIATTFTDLLLHSFQGGWMIGSFALGLVLGLGVTFLVLMLVIRLAVWIGSKGTPPDGKVHIKRNHVDTP